MTDRQAQPRLVIAAEDYGRLAFLATASMMARRRPPAGAVLADELVRAAIVAAADIPPSVVTMRSAVEFRDDNSGQISRVSVVYPGEEDSDSGLVSVLTPIGAALIGLSEGQSIRWRSALGGWRDLTVLRVRQVPRDDPGRASPDDATSKKGARNELDAATTETLERFRPD
jgi:regulator of nucleoside diphosphate kinase